MGLPPLREAEGKTRERYIIFEVLCITGVNPTHFSRKVYIR